MIIYSDSSSFSQGSIDNYDFRNLVVVACAEKNAEEEVLSFHIDVREGYTEEEPNWYCKEGILD